MVKMECHPCKLECHALRLKPGDELVSCLLKFVKDAGLQAAFVMTCCGSVTRATLRYSNVPDEKGVVQLKGVGGQNKVETLRGQFEILSLVGTLSGDGGCHLHVSLGDKDGRVIGGHVMEDFPIFTTAEIVLGELKDVQFKREMDDITGYDELVINPK